MRGGVEREPGIVLTTLDLSKTLDFARQQAIEHGVQNKYDVDPADLQVRFGWAPYAVGNDPKGMTYVICHEGVGWEVSADRPLLLEVFCSSRNRFGMFSDFEVSMTLEEVQAAATGDKVDLSEHVRRFGARLESNFWSWHRTLKGVK